MAFSIGSEVDDIFGITGQFTSDVILLSDVTCIDGFIRTEVYSKPTDSHLYLPPASAHPKHVFKAIPSGVAL